MGAPLKQDLQQTMYPVSASAYLPGVEGHDATHSKQDYPRWQHGEKQDAKDASCNAFGI